MPTPSQLQPLAILLALLAAFVLATTLLRQCVSRSTAETVEAAVIVGSIAAAWGWGLLRKGR